MEDKKTFFGVLSKINENLEKINDNLEKMNEHLYVIGCEIQPISDSIIDRSSNDSSDITTKDLTNALVSIEKGDLFNKDNK